ncbi:AAA domain-containing protein [Myxococcus xanthus]|uniref:AAA domain-containing protein n=1 Tax=Myxococcus xanthus TaxID=34 RepID=UPI00112D9705|nr:AAA domain-containing protein [Myxococcus xanthus]QDE94839.1 DNA helicase [Myxococcus xanthus]
MSPEPRNRVLEKMLERLYAALASGPSLNSRPHNSRQRVDLATLSRLDGTAPHTLLAALLGEKAQARLVVKPPPPEARPRKGSAQARAARAQDDDATGTDADDMLDTAPKAAHALDENHFPSRDVASDAALPLDNPQGPSRHARPDNAPPPDEAPAPSRAEEEQQDLLRKLATIVEDARTFEQDTGAHVLHVGFPLLHLPPGAKDKRGFGTRRILAPIAFIPVRLTLKKGRVPSVELEGAEAGVDRVAPNTALLAWLEQQTGQRLGDLFADEAGEDPWRELNELVAAVCKAMELPAPAPFTPETLLAAIPRGDDAQPQAAILPSAVLGLYPLSNQSLVDDMRALLDGEPISGPLESFLRVDVSLGLPPGHGGGEPNLEGLKRAGEERLVTLADPCQARAVRLARSSRGLVIHGPPGTGKSQTIANAIGDHLARGERVLLVCDKRTALDVVKHRLDHLGLGHLCAVVHDAQRDQRDLYMGIREQLDTLPETRTDAAVARELSRIDAELQSLHDELTAADRALSERPDGGTAPSFHELVGQWFSVEAPAALTPAVSSLSDARLSDVTTREREVREVLERGGKEGYPENPWREALGTDLATYLATPMATYRERLSAVDSAARDADALASPDVPVFGADPRAEGAARAAFAEKLAPLLESARPDILARWAAATPDGVQAARTQLDGLAAQRQVLAEGPLDAELALVHREQPQALSVLATAMAALGSYLDIARKWYAFFCFARKAGARRVLQQFGLTLSILAAERVTRFFTGVKARALLTEYHRTTLVPGDTATLTDESLSQTLRAHAALFELLQELERTPLLASCRDAVRAALTADAEARAALLAGLRLSAARGDAVARLEARLAEAGLFSAPWLDSRSRGLRSGERLASVTTALVSRLPTVEGLLRMRAVLTGMPPALEAAVERLARQGAEAEAGWRAVLKATLAAEASARLREAPALQHIDAERVRTTHSHYRVLEEKKRVLVRDALVHRWTQRQRERLLAGTGGRLNGQGAELRRRLMLRGARALRVRQVIATGQGIEGGDPLFDVRPVWMASPQTVAQIFPRRPIFDVVIFDESSQCRLEEALPVLTRAHRVVIAGDPKQLPPTRFFESAVVQNAEQEAESEQGLFEEQQSEVEDLLSAALNLDIDQCYLDVHYRSQNADLIAFSNDHFYDKRLQAIPAHPSHSVPHAPLRLLPVGGTYEKRTNLVEARAVGSLVKELLSRPQPPSIGIACFNLSQRDTINDVLDEMAASDASFASRLAEARVRRGSGSFEGLFVKNLENVQGDERDHLIISTTYGPDRHGRFYRRFGPLGSAGGGRRLNVLVTRAREQIHLVTSIPRESYQSAPPMEAGRQPNGGWLLFAYLRFAEALESAYTQEARREPEDTLAQTQRPAETAEVFVRPTDAGSAFAQALAGHLATQHRVSSEVHWGNDGFCVDVALRHPTRPSDVTVGVLCDGTRYPKAADRVEWDLFRTGVLEGQGWQLVRMWTPSFFRDPEGATTQVLQAAGDKLMREPSASPQEAMSARGVVH